MFDEFRDPDEQQRVDEPTSAQDTYTDWLLDTRVVQMESNYRSDWDFNPDI